MREWARILGGLMVWAAHFFAVYGTASLFPGTVLARWLTIAATIVGLVVAAWLLRRALADRRHAGTDRLKHWTSGLAAAGSGTALIAIAYQGLPALLA